MFVNLGKSLFSGIALTGILLFGAATSANAGLLYLLNDDSTGNRIYGFRVNETTGELTALGGFPVSAMVGGINNIVSERMVADPLNYRVYIVNEGSDTVSAYSINPSSGAITPLPFSPISLGAGVWNSIAVHPSGSPLIVANNALNGVVQSFVITSTTATPAAGNPFGVGSAAGFSSEFSRDGNYYYVGGNSGSNIAGFAVNSSTGVLTTLPGSPFPAGAVSVLAYATDTAGRLFSVDTDQNIRVFTSTSGVLSPVTGNPFGSGLTERRFGIVHPNGNFYIVAGNSGNNVGVYQISGSGAATTVAPVSGSPFPTGATTANCLAINSSGSFLYVGNRVSRNVTRFSVNTGSGLLTSLGNLPNNTLGTVGAINGIAYLPDAASAASISGRVASFATTFGISGVRLHLSSQDGTINFETITNPFGFYRFDSVPTGRTYTITPSHKRYFFVPSSAIINLSGDLSDINFMGESN